MDEMIVRHRCGVGDPTRPNGARRVETGAPGREGDSRAGWPCLTILRARKNRRVGGKESRGSDNKTDAV